MVVVCDCCLFFSCVVILVGLVVKFLIGLVSGVGSSCSWFLVDLLSWLL